jgi:hypothetical protein
VAGAGKLKKGVTLITPGGFPAAVDERLEKGRFIAFGLGDAVGET